ncbi:MAG: hypothetical protein ACXWZ0_10195 [Mycobacterium sp.]
MTVREAAQITASRWAPGGGRHPSDVADQMVHYLDDGGCNGFMLLATDTPGCFNDVTELLVRELQRRGRYRTRYPGTTLRESLQEY